VRADSDQVYLDFANVTTAVSVYDYHPGDGQWHRLVANNLTVTAGNSITLRVRDARAAGWTNFYIDAAQIEATAYHTPYVDGDIGDGCAWTGANHATTSTRARGYLNLNDQIETISERESYSVRCVVQAPYDHDFGYWPYDPSPIWDARGADNNNRILLQYDATNEWFEVYINGAVRLTSSVQSFTEGEWLDIIIKFNFGLYDSYELWINGTQEDTDTTALSAPTLTNWQLGEDIVTINRGAGWVYAEYTVYESDTLLTETLIDQLYLTGPTIDPESVLEDRSLPPAFWDHTVTSATFSNTLASWVEWGGAGRYRFLLSGDWGTGHWLFEVSAARTAGGNDGSVKLQYYDELNAAWRDVPGSLITGIGLTLNRDLSLPLSMIRSMHEFRVVCLGGADSTISFYKARVFNSYGGDTNL
jgi:hypothetical protein